MIADDLAPAGVENRSIIPFGALVGRWVGAVSVLLGLAAAMPAASVASMSIPTVVTKLSLSNGLIYTYSKPAGPGTTDRWCFTTIDFRTGKVVYSRLAGTGLLYNNNYEPLYLGPSGTAYMGVFGGFVAMRDAHR